MRGMLTRINELSDRALVAFDAWFCSKAGVYQTLFVVLGITVVEKIFPQLDPSMFALMVWLTIYSSVTQPALAHTGAESSARLETVLSRLETVEAQNAELERQNIATLAEVRALTAGQNERIDAIYAAVTGHPHDTTAV